MKEFNIKKLLKGNTVVNCKTEKQAKDFLKYLHSQGYSWEDGNRPLNLLFYFDKYLNETCFILTSHKTIMYASTSHYINRDYKILSLKDIKIKKEKKIMKRILHFKNPSLTKREYDFVRNCLVEVTEEDFDQAEWQDTKVYMFMTDGLEIRLSLNILDELLAEFDSVSLSKTHVYIKNKGVK